MKKIMKFCLHFKKSSFILAIFFYENLGCPLAVVLTLNITFCYSYESSDPEYIKRYGKFEFLRNQTFLDYFRDTANHLFRGRRSFESDENDDQDMDDNDPNPYLYLRFIRDPDHLFRGRRDQDHLFRGRRELDHLFRGRRDQNHLFRGRREYQDHLFRGKKSYLEEDPEM